MTTTEQLTALALRATRSNPTANACGLPVRTAVKIVNGHRVTFRLTDEKAFYMVDWSDAPLDFVATLAAVSE